MSRLYSPRPGHQETGNPGASDDQRRVPRIGIDAEVSLVDDAGDPPLTGRLVNLSEDGALVATSNLKPVGSVLRLKLRLPEHKEISTTARVRSCVPGRGNGVAFLALALEQRGVIDALIERGGPAQVSQSTDSQSVYSY